MFELLEDLRPEFTRVLRRQVDLAELTVLSLQISPRQAVVVTNRNIYCLRKGLLGVRTTTVPLKDVSLIRVEGTDLVLEGQVGQLGKLGFASRRDLQATVYRKLQGLLTSP